MAKRPNILLIMSDQHHAGILGCAGDSVIDTPNLDRLAQAGVRLHNTYCPFPLCGPSRMAFMTGRYCHEINVWTNTRQLHSDIPTFAHAFTAAGYRTALTGRMHFVGPDQRHGFLERPMGDVPGSVHIKAGWKLKDVLGDFSDTPGSSVRGIEKSGPGRSGYQAYDERVIETTKSWLEDYAAGDQEAPFLQVVGLVLPHCPFVAPPDDFARYADRISPEDLPESDPALHPQDKQFARKSGVLPPPDRKDQWRTRVAYYGMVSCIDRQIGELLETLEQTGLADNTIVVYTSDHGESLGEHGLWWKTSFYDGASRVPLILYDPRQPGQGRVVEDICNLIDIGPTLLDLAGLEPLPNISGRSLRPVLEETGEWENTTFCELTNPGSAKHSVTPCRSVRRGDWKYNYYHQLPDQLFNLTEDPGECDDRINAPDCADLACELRDLVLRDWDPQYVIDRLSRYHEETALIAHYLRAADVPEPDPIWYDEPLDNYLVEPS